MSSAPFGEWNGRSARSRPLARQVTRGSHGLPNWVRRVREFAGARSEKDAHDDDVDQQSQVLRRWAVRATGAAATRVLAQGGIGRSGA